MYSDMAHCNNVCGFVINGDILMRFHDFELHNYVMRFHAIGLLRNLNMRFHAF